MNNELKQDFTRRLSQCNQGGMIVIVYDIFFAYMDDAKNAWEKNDRESFKTAIRNVQRTLDELMQALDLSYEIARTLHPLYAYCKELLAKTLYENRLDRFEEAESIMKKLYSSFVKVAELDTSEPIMSNTQQVYAGMTYGKTALNENLFKTLLRTILTLVVAILYKRLFFYIRIFY